jgi:alpha-tubulin suppressor-like RCC1 family protein
MSNLRSYAVVLCAALNMVGCRGTSAPDDRNKNDLSASMIAVSRGLLLPGDTVDVTLETRNASGQRLRITGATVEFSLQGGTSVGSFRPVVDHNDGTYSTAFVAERVGTAVTITARFNGQAIASHVPTLRVVGFTRIAVAGATLIGAQTTTGGYSCGIITTGDMYCWGISWFGIRGNGTAGTINPGLEPSIVGGGYSWTDVAAANHFVCGVTTAGRVYCWGDGDVGELGNGLSGNSPDVTMPAPIAASPTVTFRSVSAMISGGACAVTTDGAAMCWGTGNWGRLGNGSDALSATPVAVNGGLRFDALTTSYAGTCGIAGGTAYCWGNEAILGRDGLPAPDTCNPGVACAKSPISVSGALSFRPIITLDGNLVCGVATNDQTYCWGIGTIGNGNPTSRAGTPTIVNGAPAFTSLASGDQFRCGVTATGGALCWGANGNGQLGNGTTTDALVPTPVSGNHTLTQLSASQDHTCGVATDGNAYCWGGNDKGELGTRSQMASHVPARVRLFTR